MREDGGSGVDPFLDVCGDVAETGEGVGGGFGVEDASVEVVGTGEGEGGEAVELDGEGRAREGD